MGKTDMSRTPHGGRLDRRAFIGMTAAGMAGATTAARSAAEEPKLERPRHPDADAALERLRAGNRRFVTGKIKRVPVTPKELAQLEKGQQPFATILGCSDSRVPIELVFDQGLGELFVVRLAGNVVDPDVQGSLEYAVDHLGTRLIVVMGHQNCGAVTAAMAAAADDEKEGPGIRQLLKRIEPALKGIDPKLPQEERLNRAVEANVRLSIKQLLHYADHWEYYEKGDYDIVGAVYQMKTGKVEFLT